MQVESKSDRKPTYSESFSSEMRTLIIMVGVSDLIINRVLKFDYDQLTIDFGDWSDLSFLSGHEGQIKRLKIGSETCDWNIINSLHNIEYLSIGGWFKTELSFSKFERLRYLTTYHNDGYSDLYDLPSLEYLEITGWKEKNCEKLSTLKSLTSLVLVNSYSLVSLDGIESLNNITEIELHGLRKFKIIKPASKLKALEKLVISGCGSIECLSGLERSQSISQVYIEKCKCFTDFSFLNGKIAETIHTLFMNGLEISSLNRYFKGLRNLETLSLVGSKVNDGDLNILFKLQGLKVVWLRNNRNFKPSAKEVKEFFQSKQKVERN